MKPDKQDVLQLVIALFTLISSLERAKRHKQQAGILDLLQIIASRPGVNPSEIAAELDLNHP
jgi:hypothetical protein